MLYGPGRVVGVAHRHGCESHDRAVACAEGVGRPAERVTAALECLERGGGCAADIKAAAGAAPVPVAIPVDVALELVAGVKAAAFHQTLGQAERHGGVIGPLTGL